VAGCGGEHIRAALEFSAFAANSFPAGVRTSDHAEYLRCYLADLGAGSVLEEPHYFDRDYLAEFAAFYSTSSRGYSNSCRRLHAFSLPLDRLRGLFLAALRGDEIALRSLNQAYLGFLVVRPIAATPFGRTVLRWYPETHPETPRVTKASRKYTAHGGGLCLEVTGLAWQQQDSGVGACATVALWTMFHASALDEHHAVPTTVNITKSANARWPLGRRVFPASEGLSIHQICEAIRGQGLLPAVLDGDIGPAGFFSPARFASSCAAFLRSGYPALIGAQILLENGTLSGGHAVCAVGFRPGSSPDVPCGWAVEEDSTLQSVYVHDDNLGPSVRFAVQELTIPSKSDLPPVAMLVADPPPPLLRSGDLPNPTVRYWKLVPRFILAALPPEIRMTSDYLNGRALKIAAETAKYIEAAAESMGTTLPGITFSSGFFRLKAYAGEELASRLTGSVLAKARLALANHVRPMSLHLGVVRMGIAGTPLFDVFFDTTDSEPATDAFAHIAFQSLPTRWLDGVGVRICAF
jgi:hypothetical protein